MDEKVGIREIAVQSGVSISTVSLALNNRPGVSSNTRSRITAIAEKLGYSFKSLTNERADQLSSVGMIVKTQPNIPPLANPFYSKVIVGIEDVCRRLGIHLFFATMPVDANNRPVSVPALLTDEVADGLLMVGAFVDETVLKVTRKSNNPIVLVDAYSNTEIFDCVVSDNFRAAYQAVEYLIQKGHLHIGLIGSEEDCYPSLRDRRNGYLRAMKENGIGMTYIANFNINLEEDQVLEHTKRFLKEYPQITALFGINDATAIVAMRAAQELGLRVPQDISVVGYDNTYLATHSTPPLTTMNVDTVAMGRAAVHLLVLRKESPNAARMTLTIHPTLIERDSTNVVRSPTREAKAEVR